MTRSTSGCFARLATLLSIVFVPVLPASTAHARVNLNELTIQGAERVELYNTGPGPVSLAGWRIVGSDPLGGGGGTYFIPGGFIGPNAYLVIAVPPPGIFPDIGGEVDIIDAVGGTVDRAFYGIRGSAPLPGTAAFAAIPSLARAPDAADATPPVPDPMTDGQVWTLAFSPTFGSHNAAPIPAMGSLLRLNEIDPKPVGGLDQVELFNPTPSPINGSGYFVTNGVGSHPVTLSVIAPGGVGVFSTASGYDVDAIGLLYLFAPDGTRVDQLGFWTDGPGGAPELAPCENYGRWPDGGPPFLGFSFASSGGGMTFFPLTASPGFLNPFASCGHSAVAPPAHESTSWGRIRQLLR